MKKLKAPFVVLAAIYLAVAVFSLVLFFSAGKTHTVCYDNITYDERIHEEHVKIENSHTDVVNVTRVYVNGDNKVCFDAEALKSGEATISMQIYDQRYWPVTLKVNSLGLVFEKDTLNFTGYIFVEYGIMLCMLATAVIMFLSYRQSLKKSAYGYAMVAYGGVGLFSLATFVYTLYRLHWMNTFRHFLFNITDTGYYFVLISAPLMVILSVMFSVSNIRLITREGFRPVNMLGIALSVVWFLAFYFVIYGTFKAWFVFDYDISDFIVLAAGYMVSFMESLLLSVMVTAFMSTRHKAAYDKDYIIILGCGIRSDGTLTPLLRSRAAAALEFEKKQYEATGKHAKFVPSGGQGADEVISESEAIQRWLLEQGVPFDRIVKEDKSVNTSQNIEFSKSVILADAKTSKVRAAFATTNYHIFRGYVLSEKHKLDAEGISAKTKWYFYPNAFLREFIGLIAEQKIQIGAVMIIFALAFWFLRYFIVDMGF